MFGTQTLMIELSWGCGLVAIYYWTCIGKWTPFDLEQHMLRLQLLSKNFGRECPMVRFIKQIACFRLLGEHTLRLKLGWKG